MFMKVKKQGKKSNECMKHDVLIGDELLRVSSWCSRSLASVTRAPGLMNHLKAAAWAGDWLLVSFVNIT